jgi:transposase
MGPNSLPSPELLLTRIAELEERVRLLEVENRQLRDQLDESQRRAARQAAPFRRREAKKVPGGQKKRPGRPKGHKPAYRATPAHIDDHAEVPLAGCPGCGGAVAEVEAIEQIIEEIPPVRPRVTRLITYRGRCERCGEVHSSHPLQTSTATGAARVQLGPNAKAWALALNKQFGLTTRKTCRVLKGLVGLSLSPGGLALAARRAAEKVVPGYDQLVQEIRGSAAVFADETS